MGINQLILAGLVSAFACGYLLAVVMGNRQ